ncbi:MAG: FAD-binding protein [Planctomycetes bacterium]|nr:FAD-binding protein [Planctomycetota bacterium]
MAKKKTEKAAATKYKPLTPAIIAEMEKIVGRQYVIHSDAEKLEPFSHDEISEKEYAHMPDCVVRPAAAQEIAEIMKLANREMIAVTPRGAGSGLSGGAVPVFGGIVLLCDRMNKVIEFDKANMTITVEPGLVTNEINEIVRPAGLFYAGYPMSLETCYVGGNVAENAGGGKAVKYGVTARYVLGLEVVTPKGDIVQLGGKLVKDVTGYDLIHLMVGSEGTLGIFTKIILKLMPLPKASVDLLVLFRTPDEAIAAVPEIMTKSGIIPTAIEFMDRLSAHAACKYLNETLDYKDAGAMLLITVDGPDEQQVMQQYEAIGEQCLAAKAIEVYVADNHTTSERVWKVRRNIAEAFKVQSPRQSLEDIVVPIASIPKMVAGLEELSRKHDCQIPCYGHAGDGNLHATPVMNPKWSDQQWHDRLEQILVDMYKLTASLGGTISGEHGIGHKRKKYMPLVCQAAFIDMMRAIKLALDPNCVLNPGKIFDC